MKNILLTLYCVVQSAIAAEQHNIDSVFEIFIEKYRKSGAIYSNDGWAYQKGKSVHGFYLQNK